MKLARQRKRLFTKKAGRKPVPVPALKYAIW